MMKYKYFFLFIFFACNTSPSTTQQNLKDVPLDANTTIQDTPSSLVNNGIFTQEFINSFPLLSLPYSIDEALLEAIATRADNFTSIPTKLAIQFLDVEYIDFGEVEEAPEDRMPNGLCAYVGRFEVNAQITAIIYKHQSLPVGSGDNIHFVLTTLDKKSLQTINSTTIATSNGWDGGYNQQTCTIKKNFSIEGKIEKEDENYEQNLYSMRKESYHSKITDKGKIEEKTILLNEEKRVLDVGKDSGFDVMKVTEIADLPKNLPTKGELHSAYLWDDKLGKNVLIFTTIETKGKTRDARSYELWAYHFLGNNQDYTLLWDIKDFNRDCEFDNMLQLLDNSILITDLDKDKIAESTFLYTNDCISDVSPYTLKLMMHENSNKYAIRGQIRWAIDIMPTTSDEPQNQVKNIDEKSFAKAPASFTKFASEHWDKFDIR